jgi:hypothetical protein
MNETYSKIDPTLTLMLKLGRLHLGEGTGDSGTASRFAGKNSLIVPSE